MVTIQCFWPLFPKNLRHLSYYYINTVYSRLLSLLHFINIFFSSRLWFHCGYKKSWNEYLINWLFNRKWIDEFFDIKKAIWLMAFISNSPSLTSISYYIFVRSFPVFRSAPIVYLLSWYIQHNVSFHRTNSVSIQKYCCHTLIKCSCFWLTTFFVQCSASQWLKGSRPFLVGF